ncbi:hypothetical protein [Yoonia sp. 2307UL14-13]|uniref:hypothetical protein n=1 Tax=Yoonia sp. 2307UL14-13 TaxID=3126506 RepID=UPI003094EE41
MNINEMIAYLALHGVKEDEFYTIGGLGAGEIDGIEMIDGVWFTYYSERGAKRNYVQRKNEEEACAYVAERAERYAKRLGVWTE